MTAAAQIETVAQTEPNYGDVAMKLPPNWDRSEVANSSGFNFVLMIIGHVNGVSDVRLKNNPSAKHQFRFLDQTNTADAFGARMDGYKFVTQAEWDAIDLWQWNAQGHLFCLDQVLMARPGHMYFDELDARMANRPEDEDRKEALALADKHGIAVSDVRTGERLTKGRRGKG